MRGEGWGYIRIAWGACHVLVCLGDDRSVIGNAHIGDECGGVSVNVYVVPGVVDAWWRSPTHDFIFFGGGGGVSYDLTPARILSLIGRRGPINWGKAPPRSVGSLFSMASTSVFPVTVMF
jgi:hypothetical protein